MRTLFLLTRDLARADAAEVAKLARVNVKTIKRILGGGYRPRMDVAERLSSALDCVELSQVPDLKAPKKQAA